MTLAAGVSIGPYEIEAPLGAGGMGEVYRARDTKLNRHVALKVLPEAFARDVDRVARFKREAQVLATLNHPNVAAIYGFEESAGIQALVLELIEGPTLADRLRRGAIGVDEALSIAHQVAHGLEAAHERGIVHRDLKPANIKLRPDGTVKVLDFGLAKAFKPATDTDDESSAAPTHLSPAMTEHGMVVGTAAYLSPEQARALPIDKRTDIWAFGCVLYEMLTGRVAFPGETFSDTVVSILERAPDWNALPAATPAVARRLLARCLEKDHKNRLRDVGDARIELGEAVAHDAPRWVVGRARTWAVRWRWIVGGLAAAVTGVIVTSVPLFRSPELSDVQVRLNLAFEGLTGEGGTPVPSPDGMHFVFQAFDANGRRSLWLRALDAEAARPLPGTEEVEQAFWFPDGQAIGFFAQDKLRKLKLSGRAPQKVADVVGTSGGLPTGAAANGRGDIIFAVGNRSPLFRIRESDGRSEQLTRLDSSRAENSHRFPIFLPDGRRFLFLARSARPEHTALYQGTLGSSDTRRIMTLHSNVSHVASEQGRSETLVFLRDRSLLAQRFDGSRLIGEPREIVANVEYVAASLLARFAVSSDGSVLIFRPAGPGRNQLRWFDRQGNALAALGSPGESIQPRISPDGRHVLVSRPDAQTGTRELWSVDTSRGVAARLTTNTANDWWPVWGPDGASILFGSDRDGGPLLVTYRKTSMDPGNGEDRLMAVSTPAGSEAIPSDWSSDGRWVAFMTGAGGPASDVWVSPAAAPGKKAFALLASRFAENAPRFSPDARWIAYTSNETGQYEVYVRPFDGTAAGAGGSVRVSAAGGDFPVWRPDGGELFFLGGDLRLYAVPTSDLGRASVPQPQPLFTACPDTLVAGLPMRATPWDHPYDVSRDGQRFLINCLTLSPGRFDVMLNWTRPF